VAVIETVQNKIQGIKDNEKDTYETVMKSVLKYLYRSGQALEAPGG